MNLFTFYKFAAVIKDWLGKPSGRETLPVIKKPTEFKFVLHNHKSERQAGQHWDVRLLDPKRNVTFNWAVKRGLPKPGEVRSLFPTSFHPPEYLNFEGRLTGYGQGTVKIDRSEKAEILSSAPDKIKFNLYSGRTPEQYMIKATGKEGWIIRNITPSRDSKLWGNLVPSGKPKYKEKKIDVVDLGNDKEVAQAKVDGASTILTLREGKQPRVFSYRTAKSPTGLSEHTWKIKDLMTSRSPKGIGDTVLRAELFGVKGNKATPARILGGILNANTPKSREMQQEAGISLKLMPFDVVKYKGQDASAMKFGDKLGIIHRLQKKLPYLQLPITAEGTKDKAKLLKRIQAGREPLTREGIVLHNTSTGTMTKVKIKPSFSVHIRNIFAEAGNRKGLAGGFDYSLKPKGEIVGRVGTGFDLNTKKDMLANPEKYIGRVAKVEAQESFPSGALRAASFRNLHLDKNASIRTKLQSQQLRVIRRMQREDQPGLVVAHGLGSGKSLSAIGAQEALNMPATIVVPASLMSNYEKEIRKHIKGKSPSRNIVSMQNAAIKNLPLNDQMLIIDEAHRARESGTKTFSNLSANTAKKRMLLTGTPFYNSPTDIAPLVNIAAGKHMLPTNKKEFEGAFVSSERVNPGFWGRLKGIKPGERRVLNQTNAPGLRKILNKWVDYYPGSQKDFPKVKYEQVNVPMDPEQLEMYDTFMEKAPRWVGYKIKKNLPPSKQESKQLNAFLSAVRQVENTTAPFQTKGEIHEPKIQRAFGNLKKSLKNPRAKALVFSNYLEAGINPYRARLEKSGIPFGEYTGKISKKNRDELVKDYNSGKLRTLLLSSAGGEGLDLKGTRLIQILEPHWNIEKLRQAEGRGIRYMSHSHLPPRERKVDVQTYISTRSPKGLLERWGWKKPGGSTGEYLRRLSQDKENLNKQFRDMMTNESKQ